MKNSTLVKYLQIAEVPEELHTEALAALVAAEKAARGLTWQKWKGRLFKARTISKLMRWETNRLIDVKPEWARYDIAPMLNITGHGDNGPWVFPEGGDLSTGRPIQDYWLDKDPESADYQEAVSKCYWCPGHHPRSKKARKAWYLRNSGEYEAWSRGVPVDNTLPVQRWKGESGKTEVSIVRCGQAWIVNTRRKLVGKLCLSGRYGNEIDNIFWRTGQGWWPLPGFELRACVTWSTVPEIAK